MNTIERNYEQAKEKYATIGVDTDAVLEKMQTSKFLCIVGKETMSKVS